MIEDFKITDQNGVEIQPSILTLPDYRGNLIGLTSLDPASVARFKADLNGPMPFAPNLGDGGEFVSDGEVTTVPNSIGGTPEVQHESYNPAGDVINETIPTLYKAKVDAWKIRFESNNKLVDSVVAAHAARPAKEAKP